MRRTTIRMHEPLLAAAKQYAGEAGKSLTAVIEEAVTEMLARRQQSRRRLRVRFTTFRGKGLQPGVRLDDSAALRDRMDGL
jgi:hypothetical protein